MVPLFKKKRVRTKQGAKMKQPVNSAVFSGGHKIWQISADKTKSVAFIIGETPTAEEADAA